MLAEDSGCVCSRSPENTAADFGAGLPFNQAEPWVYSMADGTSCANIICVGNTIASKQNTADPSLDRDIESDLSRMRGLCRV
jgi:hypothetical protein